ncbi:hypothetical protein EUZ85_19255 [Hahella sp. KA22]|uniref:hypothetical protein n=1 Tax=Hahella sp. KA22 TaxID=1628392 RepID=UPI000FDF118F|nr:hypothetical protein [Hahella sp. KA22]AZZ92743.1 hypothetical protein ENC22_16675 [Hahella sp. KA22]QAY56117.1 hypothetical protein EUZ85_19255 [Hahella sp. KA22]
MSLIIDGVEIPVDARLDLSVSYQRLERSATHRVGPAATAIKQTLWSGKYRVTVSGSGWYPPGLQSVDFSGAVLLASIAPLSIVGGVGDIVIGADTDRRAEANYAPYAHAIMIDGSRQDAELSVAVNGDCTITPVAGAVRYQVFWFPVMSLIFSDPPAENTDMSGITTSWEMVGEQV